MGIPRVDQFTTLVQQEAHARFIGPQIAVGAAHYHVSACGTTPIDEIA